MFWCCDACFVGCRALAFRSALRHARATVRTLCAHHRLAAPTHRGARRLQLWRWRAMHLHQHRQCVGHQLAHRHPSAARTAGTVHHCFCWRSAVCANVPTMLRDINALRYCIDTSCQENDVPDMIYQWFLVDGCVANCERVLTFLSALSWPFPTA